MSCANIAQRYVAVYIHPPTTQPYASIVPIYHQRTQQLIKPRTLTGPYLGGSLIINANYNYNNFIIFAGVILLFGAALILAARLAATRNPWAVF